MSEPTRPTGAVFLSYAREDAEAAKRIAEALRGFGVEVWFDQSELRGGDAWDAKIRKQIRECTLFIPVISAKTQARREGYFRREWNLAVERTLDMSASTAFIVPVLADDTREADADVPDQFLKAHCTRLPGGEPTPQFVAQVKHLLEAPRAVETRTKAATRAPLSAAAAPAQVGRRVPATAWVAVIALAIMIGGYFWLTRPAPPAATGTEAGAGTRPPTSAPAVPAVDANSIAVLPFVNMSADKDQEFFADGISEELLNLLAKIPQLRVIARTSSFAFKGKEVGVAEIARQLNVAHVLEGSIRKSGSKIRITTQLIRTADSSHLWSDTYDRDLSDIFAVQDEISAAVVTQLKLKLLGAAPKARKTTPEAFALFLQARNLWRQFTPESEAQSVKLLQQAVVIDPTYADAWNNLALAYLLQAAVEPRLQKVNRPLVLEAAEKALAVDPELASAHARLANAAEDFDHDLAAAAPHLERAVALGPTNSDVMDEAGNLLHYLGRAEHAIDFHQYATKLDPMSPFAHGHLGEDYLATGQVDEAIRSSRVALSLSPDAAEWRLCLILALMRKGEPAAVLAEAQSRPAALDRDFALVVANHALGKQAESDRVLAEMISRFGNTQAFNIAVALAMCGETDRAFEWLERAVAQGDLWLAVLNSNMGLTKLHDDPRWRPLLQKVNMAPEHLATIKFDVKLPDR